MKKMYSLIILSIIAISSTIAASSTNNRVTVDNEMPCTIVSSVMSTTNVLCAGDCNGTALVTSTGGTMPYIISGPFTGSPATYTTVASLTGFCAGTFTVLITDALGCTDFLVVTITEPPVITFSAITTPASGPCDGTISVTALGGTGAFTYSDDGGLSYQASNTFLGECAGTYNVCVKDANGCVECASYTVGSTCSSAMTAVSTFPVTCFGFNDGMAVFSTSGGTWPGTIDYGIGPIFYSGGILLSGLSSGIYNAIITDALGCIHLVTFGITSPTLLTISEIHTDPTCFGCSDGTIIISASGGTGGLAYSINGGITFGASPNFSGLACGTYLLVVEDANGCQTTMNVTLNCPPSCTMISTVGGISNESCFGSCDGFATITSTLGTAPYFVTGPGIIPTTYLGATTLTGLCTGTYTGTISDALGCSNTVTFLINSPTLLTVTATIIAATSGCNGSITVMPSGGNPPYVFSIDGGLTYSGSSTTSSLCPGTYVICAMDVNGCIACTTVVVTGPPCSMISTVGGISQTCFASCTGTALIVSTLGTAPYVLTGIGSPLTYLGSATLTGLCAGTYTGIITDSLGCLNTVTFTITSAPLLTISATSTSATSGCNGTIIPNASGGTPIYTYSLSPSSGFTSVCAGTYTVCVSDNIGCMACTTVVVSGPPCALVTTIFMGSNPTVFAACDGTINGAVTGGTGPYTCEWIDCTTGVSTGVTISPPASGFCAGTYAFIATDANGCSDTSSCITLTNPSGIKDNNNLFDYSIYPNPTNGLLTITTDGSQNSYSVVMTNLLGKTIGTYQLKNKLSLDLYAMQLSNGIYFITIIGDNNVKQTKKVVLNR